MVTRRAAVSDLRGGVVAYADEPKSLSRDRAGHLAKCVARNQIVSARPAWQCSASELRLRSRAKLGASDRIRPGGGAETRSNAHSIDSADAPT